MSKPFKFRYVNEITGAFVLLVVTLLVAGVVIAGHAQGWFRPEYHLTLLFPAEGSLGVQEGTRVVCLGTTIGTVERMIVADDGSMQARAKIKGEFFRFLRSDSQVLVKKAFAIAGETFVEISKGKLEPLPKEGAELTCVSDTEMLKQIQDSIAKIEKTIDEYRHLAADISDQAYHLAACFLLVDQPALARRLLAEAQSEAARAGRDATDIQLLDAKAARRLGLPAEATALAEQIAAGTEKPEAKLQALIIKAHVQNDAGKLLAADLGAIRLLARDVNDAALTAEVENLVGCVAQREHSFGDAAAAFDREAAGWQRAGHFREMALALARSGAAWQSDGRSLETADRLYRAARSLFAQGDAVGALRQIEPALTAAKAATQNELAARIVALFEEIKQNVAHGGEAAK